MLPNVNFGFWSSVEQVQYAFQVNVLLVIGVLLAPAMFWALKEHAMGPDSASRRRKRRHRPGHGCFGQPRADACDHGRRDFWPVSAGRS